MPSSSRKLGELLQRHRWVALAAGFAVIEIAYVFFVSAGRFTRWPATLTFLDEFGRYWNTRDRDVPEE